MAHTSDSAVSSAVATQPSASSSAAPTRSRRSFTRQRATTLRNDSENRPLVASRRGGGSETILNIAWIDGRTCGDTRNSGCSTQCPKNHSCKELCHALKVIERPFLI
eukprot:4740126-Pleurochrysis_carterae.AAC.2